jgi:hypothetical protein
MWAFVWLTCLTSELISASLCGVTILWGAQITLPDQFAQGSGMSIVSFRLGE